MSEDWLHKDIVRVDPNDPEKRPDLDLLRFVIPTYHDPNIFEGDLDAAKASDKCVKVSPRGALIIPEAHSKISLKVQNVTIKTYEDMPPLMPTLGRFEGCTTRHLAIWQLVSLDVIFSFVLLLFRPLSLSFPCLPQRYVVDKLLPRVTAEDPEGDTLLTFCHLAHKLHDSCSHEAFEAAIRTACQLDSITTNRFQGKHCRARPQLAKNVQRLSCIDVD